MMSKGYILEPGELDCLLRNQNGVILNKVPVDPPWESSLEIDGVRFK